jgi:hypothetical protein
MILYQKTVMFLVPPNLATARGVAYHQVQETDVSKWHRLHSIVHKLSVYYNGTHTLK